MHRKQCRKRNHSASNLEGIIQQRKRKYRAIHHDEITRRNHNYYIRNKNKKIYLGEKWTEDIEIFHIGDLDSECSSCGALSFRMERGRVKHNCCHGGKVKLDTAPLFPKKLRRLFTANSQRGIQFRKLIRFYNNSFAMASFCPKEEINHRGVGSMKIGGEVNAVVTTSLFPSEGQTARNAQIYLCEFNEALKLRQFQASSTNIVKMIQKIMSENHYVKIYRSLMEIYRENHGCESILYFRQSSAQTSEERRYDVPSGLGARSEIGAVLITGKEGEVPQDVEFRVYPKHSMQCQKMHKLSHHAEPMLFPLLFPNGQNGYSIYMNNNAQSISKK